MKMIEWKSRCNHVMMNRRPVPPTDDMVRLTLIDYLVITVWHTACTINLGALLCVMPSVLCDRLTMRSAGPSG